MAQMELHFHSDALQHAASMTVILPERARTRIGMQGDRGDTFPTLYLLHGLSDDHTIWLRRTSVERYAARYGLAVVMPNAERSWYCDMAHGERYYQHIAQEVPALCRSLFRGMSERPEDTYIAGLSMGGYGALKIALRSPGVYGGVASFSGALNVAERHWDTPAYWEDVFGARDAIRGSENDVYALAEQAARQGTVPSRCYLSCGTEDGLLDDTRRMRDLLLAHGVTPEYHEQPGEHCWDVWDDELERSLAYFFS